MALNPDIRDQAYQFFIEEAPELLQSLEAELLTLSQDHSTAKIHSLMRTAHSIKGGAASVGLEAIAALAHRLENIFKALYGETTVIDTDLESQLLQAYDCLQLPLNQQITTGYLDAEQATEMAEPIFAQIEANLSDALIETENYVPTSDDLGVDMVSSILEVDIAQGIEHLAIVVDDFENYEVAGELRAQAEVFAGFAELLNLPAFGAIAEIVQRALDMHPYRALDIAKLAIDNFERVRQFVLAEKHLSAEVNFEHLQMLPSEALVAFTDSSRPYDHAVDELHIVPEETQNIAQLEAAFELANSLISEVSEIEVSEVEDELDSSEVEYALGSAANVETSIPILKDGFGDAVDANDFVPSESESEIVHLSELGGSEHELGIVNLSESEPFEDEPEPSERASEFFEMQLESSDVELETSEVEFDELTSALVDFLVGEPETNPVESDDSESGTVVAIEVELSGTEMNEIGPDEITPDELSLQYSSGLEPESLSELEVLSTEADDFIENDDIYHENNVDNDGIIVLSEEDLYINEIENDELTLSEELISSSIVHVHPYSSGLNESLPGKQLTDEPASIEDVIDSIEHSFEELPTLDGMADDTVEDINSQLASFIPKSLKISSDSSNFISSDSTETRAFQAQHSRQSNPQNYRQASKYGQKKKSPTATPHLTIRVEAERLERMSNLVGELAINRDGLSVQNDQLQGALKELLGRFSRFQERIDQLRNLSDQMLVAPERSRQSQTVAISGTNSSFVNNDLRFSAQDTLEHSLASSSPASLPTTLSTEFDSLEMDSYGVLHLKLQEIFEDFVQLEEMVDDVTLFAKQSDQTLGQQKQMLIQLRDDLTWARMVPLSEVFNRFPRMLRDLSINYHKPVDLTLTGTGVLVDKVVLEKLYDPLLHLLRNAFDHGIEPPDVRRRIGKPEAGKIEIRAYHRGNQTIIQVEDDGQGLNVDKICDRAVERGWFTTEEVSSLSTEQLYELIFEPGFSTANQVSELSGRGVGLDVVRAQLHDVRGTVTVTSTPGQGTIFTLHLPLTLTITKLISFSSGSVVLAISADSVEEIITPQSDRIRQLGRQRFLQWQENIIPIHRIADLLHYNCPLPEMLSSKLSTDITMIPKDWGAPMLILRRERQMFAVEVDRIITEQELVVKSFGTAIAPPPYAYGCTILGDGSVIPVIDGTALLMFGLEGSSVVPSETVSVVSKRAASTADLPALPAGPQAPAIRAAQATTLLVVDDSATLRRTLALSLERSGFRVLQARDGQEAINRLHQSTSVKLVVCDIEMPNMNGFEFLSQRRQDPKISDIPVVMLTSRSNEKHRWLAMQLGASAYFTKPYLEQEFIETLEDILH